MIPLFIMQATGWVGPPPAVRSRRPGRHSGRRGYDTPSLIIDGEADQRMIGTAQVRCQLSYVQPTLRDFLPEGLQRYAARPPRHAATRSL